MLKKLKTLIFKDKIKAVIFDYDGVLNNSLSDLRKVWNEFYNQGISTKYFETDKEFSNCFQGDPMKNLLSVGVSKENISKCHNIIREMLPELDKEAELYPGVDNLLKKLKNKGYKVGIVSNSLKDMMIYKLKKHDLNDYVDFIIGHDEVKNPKPDSEGLLKCMKELKVKPSETIYVGDMESDVKAGKSADVKFVIAVTYGYLSLADDMSERLKDADIMVEDVDNLSEKIMKAGKK